MSEKKMGDCVQLRFQTNPTGDFIVAEVYSGQMLSIDRRGTLIGDRELIQLLNQSKRPDESLQEYVGRNTKS